MTDHTFTVAQAAAKISGADYIVKTINHLREEEGDSVTILCDNPDFNGQPNCAIECNGQWTGWEDKRFVGANLIEALSAAYLQCIQLRAAADYGAKWSAAQPPAAPRKPICCYCDNDLCCAHCGREQPDDSEQPPAAPVEPCPYAIDGCVLENGNIGPCLCANPVSRSSADNAQVNCDCGFSAEECKTNPCLRKKVHLAGLTPGSKWPHTGNSAGTREVDTFQSDKCPTCLGDGYIGQHANLPDVKCPNCSGTGFVDTAPNVELLIENLVQAAAEYENNCDRLVAKTIRVQLEKAKQAIRDAITTQPQRSAETAQVRFGFASFKGGKFELIVINIKTGEEVLLEGQLRPDQTIEQIDKVLPTCVYVTGEPQTAPLPVEAIRAAVTLLARKITKLRWSRDECRRKGQDVYVANLTAQIDQLDGYYHALSSLALSRPQHSTGETK